MPYKTRKVRNQSCYKVYNPESKKVFAKCSTKEKAAAQMRLLRGIQNNKTFRKRIKNTRRKPITKIKRK